MGRDIFLDALPPRPYGDWGLPRTGLPLYPFPSDLIPLRGDGLALTLRGLPSNRRPETSAGSSMETSSSASWSNRPRSLVVYSILSGLGIPWSSDPRAFHDPAEGAGGGPLDPRREASALGPEEAVWWKGTGPDAGSDPRRAPSEGGTDPSPCVVGR